MIFFVLMLTQPVIAPGRLEDVREIPSPTRMDDFEEDFHNIPSPTRKDDFEDEVRSDVRLWGIIGESN